MNIEIFGDGERQRAAKRILESEGAFSGSAKLLPIPSTKDGVFISGTDVSLESVIEGVSFGDFVIGYGLPESFSVGVLNKGAKLYDAARDEDFLFENAYITALGTIGYLLTTKKKIPSELKFGVIGYGRIGSCLVRLLLFLGAELKVFSSKRLTRIELGLCGLEVPNIKASVFPCENISDLDFLINTAPTDLSYLFPEKTIPEGMRVIDLASGDSFPGIRGVEYLPSLPNRMYPESAGAVYARHALLWLQSKK